MKPCTVTALTVTSRKKPQKLATLHSKTSNSRKTCTVLIDIFRATSDEMIQVDKHDQIFKNNVGWDL